MGEIRVGDTVRVADWVNNAHAGLTGRVTSIAESLWGQDRDAVTFVFGTPELPVCFERKWLEPVEPGQVTEDEGARVLKRAKAKAQRQQVKAAEKMRLAARYLNDLAEKCEKGKRVESLRNETELLVDAQFLLGQADALRDLDEWIGETDGE